MAGAARMLASGSSPQCGPTVSLVTSLVLACFLFSSRVSRFSLEPEARSVSHQFKFPQSDKVIPNLLEYGETPTIEIPFSVNVSGVSETLDSSSFSVSCNNSAVLDGDTDCDVAVSEVTSPTTDGTSSSEYSVLASCVASRFPGSVACSVELEESKRDESEAVSVDVSPSAANLLIAGLALYNISEVSLSGDVLKNTTIYSGRNNKWTRDFFYSDKPSATLFGARVVFPNGAAVTGEIANTLFNEAQLSMAGTDALFLYDESACRPGNFSETEASQSEGFFELGPSESCGFGTASSSIGSDAVLGVRVRPFKSGTKAIDFSWWDFGYDDFQFIEYNQTLVLEVGGAPPPVLKDLEVIPGQEISAVPCPGSPDVVRVSMYNVNASTSRELVLKSEEDVIWKEDDNSFMYDLATDTATSNFTSPGGSGRNVSYEFYVTIGSEERLLASTANGSSVQQRLNFSLPVFIENVLPNLVGYEGGSVVLLGSFHGFNPSRDFILVDSDPVRQWSIASHNDTHIELEVPPKLDSGEALSLPVQVTVCNQLSNNVTLIYGEPPVARIQSLDISPSSVNDSVVFSVPVGAETLLFTGSSLRSNLGLTYLWELQDGTGRSVALGGTRLDDSVLLIRTEDLQNAGDQFRLSLTLESPSGSDTASAQLLQQSNTDGTLSVVVSPVQPFSMTSVQDEPLVVYGTVKAFGMDIDGREGNVSLRWTYRDTVYEVAPLDFSISDTRESNSTGPTLFGLEFVIMKSDLAVGSTKISLEATLDSPRTAFSGESEIVVTPSQLVAVINNGANGNLIVPGKELLLSALHSYDPDNMRTQNLTFEWTGCFVSNRKDFEGVLTDCGDTLPTGLRGAMELTIQPDVIKKYIPEAAEETFFLFSLQISTSNRSRLTKSWFQVKKTDDGDPGAGLDLVRVEDGNGIRLDSMKLNPSSDIVVRPLSKWDDTPLSWRFEGLEESENDFVGTIAREGPGWYSTSNSRFQSLALVIAGGRLEAAREYGMRVLVRNDNTGVISELVVLFKTGNVPRISCHTHVVEGVSGRTLHVVSSRTSFVSPDFRTCILLSGSDSNNIYMETGFGCSSNPVVTTQVHMPGVYDVICELRSVHGNLLVSLASSSPLQATEASPTTEVDATDSGAEGLLSNRTLSAIEDCLRFRDIPCFNAYVYGVSWLLSRTYSPGQTRFLSPSDISQRGKNLRIAHQLEDLDLGLEIVARLASAVRVLSFRADFSPLQVLSTLRRASAFASLPSSVFEVDSLLNALIPLSLGVESSRMMPTRRFLSAEIADAMRFIANSSITTAGNLMVRTTGRRGSDPWDDVTSSRALFALVLDELPMIYGHMVLQQEYCGFQTILDTSFPGGSAAYPPVDLYLNVICRPDDASPVPIDNAQSAFREVGVSLCPEIIETGGQHPWLARYPILIRVMDPDTYCSTRGVKGLHSIFTAPTRLLLPLQSKTEEDAPAKCVRMRVPRIGFVRCNYTTPLDVSVDRDPDEIPPTSLRAIPEVMDQTVNIAGGEVSPVGSIKNATVPVELAQFSSHNIETWVAVNWVRFELRRGADFVAGNPRDPGLAPSAVASIAPIVLLGVMVVACALISVGVVLSQVTFLVGEPPRDDPEAAPRPDRDGFGRNPEGGIEKPPGLSHGENDGMPGRTDVTDNADGSKLRYSFQGDVSNSPGTRSFYSEVHRVSASVSLPIGSFVDEQSVPSSATLRSHASRISDTID